jgi:hypothetical protein
MKNLKIFIIFIAIFTLFQFWYWFDFQANCEEKIFVVTAYYSPKSWQAFYYKDTFEAEKALNWEWLHGASGKPVFNGMLAAPSSYDFGGLLYFPSLGWVWEIADRWWAIVHAWEQWQSYDRIDVRMWTWELWLVKALVFGKQTITGYYCNAATVKSKWIKTKIGFDLDTIPVLKYFFDATLFLQELKYERTDVWVYKLQEYLMKFGYMNKKTGYFWWETKNALCKYQVSRWISTWKYCGTFGSNTRYFMKNEAKLRWFLPDFSETTTIEDLIYYSKNYNFKSNVILNENNTMSSWAISEGSNKDSSTTPQNDTQPKIINYFTEPYNNGIKNNKIWDLQDMLRHYGFYEWELTNTYDKKTINAVHNFQVAMWILKASDKTNAARWRMWPSTRNKLNEKRTEFQEFKNNQ